MLRKKKSTYRFFLYLTLVGGIALILFQSLIPDKDFCYACCFVIYYTTGLFTIWHAANKTVNPFLLFYLTFGLFIGGRFFAVFFGYDEESIWQPTFFYDYRVPLNRKIETLRYVYGFMASSILGYAWAKRKEAAPTAKWDIPLSERTQSNLNLFIKWCFPIFLTITIFISGKDLTRVLQGGYLALYMERQTDTYSVGANLLLALNSIFFGLAMGYGDKRTQKLYLFLFVIRALVEVAIGTRRSFGALILILLWIWAQRRNVPIWKIGVLLIGGAGLLILVATFSIRALAPGSTMINYDQIAYSFIYSQGISLMVFDASRLIADYPVIGYFNNLIPGTNFIYSLFSGKTLYPQDIDFSNWMCYQLNPELFTSGAGLGWSILSDLYLYAGRMLLPFCILSSFWGIFLGKLENLSEHSRILKSWLFMVIVAIVIIPRSSLGSIFPQLYYLLFFTFITIFIVQQLQAVKK